MLPTVKKGLTRKVARWGYGSRYNTPKEIISKGIVETRKRSCWSEVKNSASPLRYWGLGCGRKQTDEGKSGRPSQKRPKKNL